MKHTVTLDNEDIKQIVREHIEKSFPGFTLGTMRIDHTAGTQREPATTEIRVDLGRPVETKD
ncbi:hypothetical protein vBRpoSV10_71 [Ruegeria phage vB_RpoS-V10]|nr:hypothetical protein DSS3P8_071 [Roseobacter phage DSS3P8]AWY09193.1 hypothetical protein vBRpoSV10_71 [Ruegeria phage vB_RpoS-V10]